MLFVGDARKLPIKSKSARLVYADPPHGYDKDRFNLLDYSWIKHAVRVMARDSYLLITTCHNTRFSVERIMRQEHSYIKYEQDLVWFYNFGIYTRKRFVPSHQIILVYKQGSPPFYWKKIAIESQRMQSGDTRADMRGRTPPTVLQIPRLPGNSLDRSYLDHAKGRTCQPEELCRTFVRAYTKPGDTVVDLFTGSGTMYKVAKLHGCQVFGLDIVELFVRQAKRRYTENWKRIIERITL